MRGHALHWLGLFVAVLTPVLIMITPSQGYTIGDAGMPAAIADHSEMAWVDRISAHLYKAVSPSVDPDFVAGRVHGAQLRSQAELLAQHRHRVSVHPGVQPQASSFPLGAIL